MGLEKVEDKKDIGDNWRREGKEYKILRAKETWRMLKIKN